MSHGRSGYSNIFFSFKKKMKNWHSRSDYSNIFFSFYKKNENSS